jgi:hypothetical protein
MAGLKPGQRDIIHALRYLRGRGTPRKIAEVTNKQPDGVAKSLEAMPTAFVRKTSEGSGDGLDRVWALR